MPVIRQEKKNDRFFAQIKWAKLRQSLNRTPLRTVLLTAILSRLLVFAVAITSNQIFGLTPSCHTFGCWSLDLPFFNLFSRWDSGFYGDIALYGYTTTITARWEFFPFYPILIGILGRLLAVTSLVPLKLAVHVAGFAVSNLAFLGSVYYLFMLSDRVFGSDRVASNSALFLALYPAGVFLSAVYSESVFLLLTLSSLYYWRLGRTWKSGILGFLGALTRPVGIFLIVPYIYEMLFNRSRRKLVSMYVPIATVLLGYLSFMVYSQIMTGTPFANFVAERLYFSVTYNLHAILVLASNEIRDHPTTIPFLVLGIGGVVASIATARSEAEKGINLHATCLLILYLLTPPIISFPRYSITLVPIYWSLSKWSQRFWVKVLMMALFLALLAIGTGLFVNWYSFY